MAFTQHPLMPGNVQASYCKLLQVNAIYCKLLQVIASYCNLLQFTASYCKLLKVTASYCKLMQVNAAYTSLCLPVELNIEILVGIYLLSFLTLTKKNENDHIFAS